MKKITTTMLTAVAAMLLAACSSNDELQQQTAQPENGGWSEYVTITAGTPGDAGTTTGGSRRVAVDPSDTKKSLWENGDQLTIWTGETCSTANMSPNGFTLISGAGTGTAKFSGRLTSDSEPTSTTKLIAVIDNENDAIDASEGYIVYVDLSPQRYCTAESALDHELFYATSTNGERNFTFTHKLALIKWTIKVNGASAGDKCDITLREKLYGDALADYYYFDPNTGKEDCGPDEDCITLKDVTLTSANSTELYVVMAPASYTGITATLTMTSGEKAGQIAYGYLGDGNSISFAENKYYTAGINEFTLNEYVDLGLPSGTKWATMNVGASKPEEYGDFFAWGETTGYSSSSTSDGRSFDWASYKWMTSGHSDWNYITKYSFADGQTDGIWYSGDTFVGDGKTTLEAADDAATAKCGSAWKIPKMPTLAQCDELMAHYPYRSTTGSKRCCWLADYNSTGVSGLAFYDASDNILLFLPAAGGRYESSLDGRGSYGFYWVSELRVGEGNSAEAWCMTFTSGQFTRSYFDRRFGRSVRAVCAQ